MGKKQKRKKKLGRQEPKTKHMVSRGTDPSNTDSPLTFNFSKHKWIKSTSVKGFTNKLDDEKMFSRYMFELFHKLIPLLHEHGENIILKSGTSSWKHCHPIRNEELDLALEIATTIHGDKVLDVGDGSKLWQFGFTGGIRLIAIHNYINNYLTPLFIDYHHQIYPSVKHNDKELKRYTFCPIDTFS